MAQTFKSLPARTLEARNRARKLSVRIEQVVAARHYRTRSQSQAGVSYNLDKGSKGWTCECQGYYFTGCCKHLAGLQRRSEREGWDFGKIAPLPIAFNDTAA